MRATNGTGGPGASSAPPGGGHNANLDADNAVGPLLARANLLRMRGQWDEAITVCADALRRAPESPTAHSLMGDIYDAQGKSADAAQWYAMALDIAPDSRPDREKLERLTKAAQQIGLPATIPPAPKTGTGAPASERTLEWFDRVFPPGKGEGIARLIFAVSGVATVLILGAAAFLYFTFVRDDARETETQAGRTGLVAPTTTQPSGDGSRGVLAATPTASPAPSVSPVGATSPSPAASASPAATIPTVSNGSDEVLLAALKAATPSGVVVTGARFDERTSQVLLEATLPAPVNGDTPAATRERVLRAAVLVAKAAQAADKRMVRANVRIALQSDKGASIAPSLAFVGDTTSVQIGNADPATNSFTDLIAHFANPWWAIGLAPGA